MKDKFYGLKNKAKYIVWQYSEGEPELNIEGDELSYSQLGSTHDGLQCNHHGDTEVHNLIKEKCRLISKLFKEVDILNTLQKQNKD